MRAASTSKGKHTKNPNGPQQGGGGVGKRFVNGGLRTLPHSRTQRAWADPAARKGPNDHHNAQTTQAQQKQKEGQEEKQKQKQKGWIRLLQI